MTYASRSLLLLVWIVGAGSGRLFAQTPPTLTRVEPGLEQAVKWKWRVAPSEGPAWGVKTAAAAGPAETAPPAAESTPVPTPLPLSAPDPMAGIYVVKKGDRLVRIAKEYGLTVNQIKTFNELKTDLILVGQELKIPNRAQALAIEPFPEPPKKKKADASPDILQAVPEDLALQVLLDREQFSSGPISSEVGVLFHKVMQLYLAAHPEAADLIGLKERARAVVGDGLTRYTLKSEDFQFIALPRLPPPNPRATPGKSKPVRSDPPPVPPPTYPELISASMLAYQSPWEFVAERFHCEEAFLRGLNPQIGEIPSAGTEFRVPNVAPFEIETALTEPLQPAKESEQSVTAEVKDLELLSISKGGRVVAVMPISIARPGLRGRGSWMIMEAIPRPRMATLREPKDQAPKPPRLFGSGTPEPTPTPKPTVLAAEEFLPNGPNNPVGILWINLAKANGAETIPYGLHGTSIPDRMKTTESIGGIRLANWDIARAVRMLPPGTPLEWKQQQPTVRPLPY